MNLPPSAQQITEPRRLAAHLDSAIPRLRSYLQYIGFVKYTEAATLCLPLQEFNHAWIDPKIVTMLEFLFPMTQNYLSLADTITSAQLAHSAQQNRLRNYNFMKAAFTYMYLLPSNVQYVPIEYNSQHNLILIQVLV